MLNLEGNMRQIIQAIWINKKIFIMLFLGFLLTILPILVALSTQKYYDQHFYYSKNGEFRHYYSINLSQIEGLDLSIIQDTVDSNIQTSSVITKNIEVIYPELGPINIIGVLNSNWFPPLVEGTTVSSGPSNEIVIGRMLADHIGKINILDTEYDVKGIAGVENTGRDLTNVFNYNMYVYLTEVPNVLKNDLMKKEALHLMFRSNKNPQNEINLFISKLKEHYPLLKAEINDETQNYKKEKKSREGVNEVLSYPYKLFLISLINCINVSYLWIYLKRKEISLRKALGASNLNLFIYIFSQLLVCASLAALCAFFIQWMLSQLDITILNTTTYYINLNLNHIILGFFITFLTAVLTSLIPLIHTMKIQPAKALKE